MIVEADRKHSRGEEKLNIVAVGASEQTRRVQEAVARRAYEIFESRGSACWHELEDWRQAEAELVRPSCFGRMSVDGTLWMGTDAAIFAGEIGTCATEKLREPRHCRTLGPWHRVSCRTGRLKSQGVNGARP
jgi:hypothetical protein